MEIKENDIFRIKKYKDEYRKKESDIPWCFEGILVTKKHNNKLFLNDTYWSFGVGGDCTKSFSLDEVDRYFELEKMGNFNDLEKIPHYDVKDYEDKDIVTITEQHACCNSCFMFFKRKGAKKSRRVMINCLIEKNRELESNINYEKRRIELNLEEIKALSDKNTQGDNDERD